MMNRRPTALAFLAASLLSVALVIPALAGEVTCALQATVGGGSATEVDIGEEVLIEGFDFVPGNVEVSYSVDGTFLRSETVTADGSGLFETTATPAAGQDGLWAVEATDAGEACTASTGFLVLAAPAPTVAPTAPPSPAPSVTPLPDAAMSQPVDAAVPALSLGAIGVLLLLARRRLATAR